MKKVITYGTFDIIHPGHIHLFKKAKSLGDYLIVGLSTDEFAKEKGKTVSLNYAERKTIIQSIRYVDEVIPEHSHDQKEKDVKKYGIDIFVMGGDYKGAHNFMKQHCKVVYVPRLKDLSSSKIKKFVQTLDKIK
jgi:glycerol-3-phosphate cytidylyltransferase